MANFDENVSNYTLSELLQIADITDEEVDVDTITNKTNILIK